MNIEDYPEFAELCANTHESMAGGNKNFRESVLEMIFEDLEDYPLEDIKKCIKRHRKTAQFAPTPFDIITMINERGNKHIGVEEAWALAQDLFDESKTVVVTQEIMDSWVLAESLMQMGDKYSAARAFKEKYSALVKSAPEPVWFATLGENAEQRKEVITKAVQLNRLSYEQGSQLCIGLEKPTVTVAGLLESAAKKGFAENNREQVKERLAGLRLVIDNTKPEKSQAELLREHEALLRDQHQQKLEQLRDLYPSEFMAHESAEEVSTS